MDQTTTNADDTNLKVTTRRDSVEITITLPNTTGARTGGHDYTLLDTSLSSTYTCIICKLIQREPTIVSCCGQHFCRSCLQRWLRSDHLKCPHCLASDLQYFTNKQQLREVSCLLIRCPNEDRGCRWTGELGEGQKHLEEECEKAAVCCPKHSGGEFMRCKLGDH